MGVLDRRNSAKGCIRRRAIRPSPGVPPGLMKEARAFPAMSSKSGTGKADHAYGPKRSAGLQIQRQL